VFHERYPEKFPEKLFAGKQQFEIGRDVGRRLAVAE
jgi:hypothetical protein